MFPNYLIIYSTVIASLISVVIVWAHLRRLEEEMLAYKDV